MPEDEPSEEELVTLLARAGRSPRVMDALEKAISEQAAKRRKLAEPDSVEHLLGLARSYHERPERPFEVFDLVEWKPGLKNRTRPDYGIPVVVLEVVDPPALDTEKTSASPYFREALGLRCGYLDEDGDFLTYHYDASRLVLFNSDVSQPD